MMPQSYMRSFTATITLSSAAIRLLRNERYNASLTEVLPIHSELRVIRVVPDSGLPVFEAGQFLSLGLGNWEPRIAGVDQEQLGQSHSQRLTKRAYSISCSLLDSGGLLRPATEFPYLEFFVALLRHGQKRAPSLTPRLFALNPGDRLFVDSRAAGGYTLRDVQPDNDVFFFATGTGEAPHNAMIAELFARGHCGRIVNAISVRNLRDAAYRLCHEEIMRQYPNYVYFVLVTREAQTRLVPAGCRYGCHLQDFVTSGELEHQGKVALDPTNAHVFLCGNPKMIGAEHRISSSQAAAKPGGMLDVLSSRGFQCDRIGHSGNIHFERYW